MAYKSKRNGSCHRYYQVLAKEGETVELNVDNQVVYNCLSKGGGRKSPFNQMLLPLWDWLMQRGISLQVRWVPSAQCLADPISRWSQDHGDYSLNPALFAWIRSFFAPHIQLRTDLFASPGNKKLPFFVARWPHWQAAGVDALQFPLDQLESGLYANPPWSIIQKFLPRLREYPRLPCLMVVPYWVSAIWWPQLIKLKV